MSVIFRGRGRLRKSEFLVMKLDWKLSYVCFNHLRSLIIFKVDIFWENLDFLEK